MRILADNDAVMRRGGMAGGAKWTQIAIFARWYLASGAANLSGLWSDLASWADAGSYLATGRANVFGAWADGEAW